MFISKAQYSENSHQVLFVNADLGAVGLIPAQGLANIT